MGANNGQNSMLGSVTVTERSPGATYTLDASSNYYQIFTGNGDENNPDEIILPDPATIELGRQFWLCSTGLFPTIVRAATGSEICRLGKGGTLSNYSGAARPVVVTCFSTDSGIASWAVEYTAQPGNTFVPEITFATPGDLSMDVSFSEGHIRRSVNIAHVVFNLFFTPTYTTASGDLRIKCPVHFKDQGFGGIPGVFSRTNFGAANSFPYPASCTSVVPVAENLLTESIIVFRGMGSAVNDQNLTTAQFPSGTMRVASFMISGEVG